MAAAPLIFALAVLASTAAAQAPEPEQLLAAHSDGSWQVLEAIHEQSPRLASVTSGLLTDEEEWTEAQNAAKAIAEAEAESAAQRAFEEAVDAARREPRP